MSTFTRAFNKLGGYDKLAARYPGAVEPEGTRWDRQCAEFGGAMRYDWCTTLIVALSGLHVQARPPAQGTQAAIFVPWNEIRDVREVRLYWRRAVQLTCGEPPVGKITLWRPAWDAAAPLRQAAWQTGR
jgi:hypothetical protein